MFLNFENNLRRFIMSSNFAIKFSQFTVDRAGMRVCDGGMDWSHARHPRHPWHPGNGWYEPGYGLDTRRHIVCPMSAGMSRLPSCSPRLSAVHNSRDTVSVTLPPHIPLRPHTIGATSGPVMLHHGAAPPRTNRVSTQALSIPDIEGLANI